SSRRRHTRFSRDWSSDVCSSDLFLGRSRTRRTTSRSKPSASLVGILSRSGDRSPTSSSRSALIGLSQRNREKSTVKKRRGFAIRSEERRVGKEGRGGWSREH